MEKIIEFLTERFDKLEDKLGSLPCAKHEEKLCTIHSRIDRQASFAKWAVTTFIAMVTVAVTVWSVIP